MRSIQFYPFQRVGIINYQGSILGTGRTQFPAYATGQAVHGGPTDEPWDEIRIVYNFIVGLGVGLERETEWS